jgi:hypothetical protein
MGADIRVFAMQRRLGVMDINKRPFSTTPSILSDDNKTGKDDASKDDLVRGPAFDDEDNERYTVVKFINPQHSAPVAPARKKTSRGAQLGLKPKRHGAKVIPRMKAPQAIDLGM